MRESQRGYGYRHMTFDQALLREKVLASRKLFLEGLERMEPLSRDQRAALDREWANFIWSVGALRIGRVGRPRKGPSTVRRSLRRRSVRGATPGWQGRFCRGDSARHRMRRKARASIA